MAGALGWLVDQSGFRYAQLYSGNLTHDVVVVGNSRALNTVFVPQLEAQTDLSAINIAYQNLQPAMLRVLTLDYLDHNTPPDFILLEVTAFQEEQVLQRSIPDAPYEYRYAPGIADYTNFMMYARHSARLRVLVAERAPTHAAACQLMHLYCFNGEMLLRTLYYLPRSDQDWVNTRQITPDVLDSLNYIDRVAIYYDETHDPLIADLADLVETVEGRGVPVRLFMAPYLPDYAALMPQREAWLTQIEAVTGHTVHDYTFALEQPELFADRIHTNDLGARAVVDVMLADGLFDLPAD